MSHLINIITLRLKTQSRHDMEERALYMEEEQGRTGEEEKRICRGGEIILGGRG